MNGQVGQEMASSLGINRKVNPGVGARGYLMLSANGDGSYIQYFSSGNGSGLISGLLLGYQRNRHEHRERQGNRHDAGLAEGNERIGGRQSVDLFKGVSTE